MIEAIMFFVLGFLAASLVALVLLSAVWHRAVRLTTRRIEGAIPVSMAEIQADKDQLRAEFAMSTRRLETSVEQLKLKTTEQLAEIGRKSESIRLLKTEVEEKTASITALEAQDRTQRERLRSTEEELALKSKALNEAEVELSARTSELNQITRSLSEKTAESDSRRIEAVALETQCQTLNGRVAELEREVAATEARLADERKQSESTSRLLAEEREKVADLSRRLAEYEARMAEGKAETEALSQTIASLEQEARRQAEIAAERDRALAAAQADIERSREEMLSAHREIDNVARSYSATIENLKAEKSMLEGALAQLRDDRDRLQQESTILRQEAESAWSNERIENALLRERINDVAAEVAHLAANLEGPGSPIDQIIAEAPSLRQNGPNQAPDAGADPDGGARTQSLAERIRTLQLRSGRR
jgi:chromosome segregation ATPase